MPALILASASPRRRQLLGLLGISFTVVATGVEELTEGVPSEQVVANALRKARAAAATIGVGIDADEVVLGVDTDVVLDGVMLGKPADATEAAERLRTLSGRTHEVLSGLALIGTAGERTGLARTEVAFRDLSEVEVRAYAGSGEWRDRAGGYAVQGLGSSLVDRIDGDLSNVIGLPIPALLRMIEELQAG